MKTARYVTVMLVPDGAEASRGFRVRRELLRLIIGVVAVLLIGIVLFFSFYGKVLMRAALADKLIDENEQLRRYQFKAQLLEDNLEQAREIVSRLTRLAGIDYEFPEFPDDSAILAAYDQAETAILTRPAGIDPTWPTGLPIQGFITQDFEIEDIDHYHPGIDIACAVGTPVLVTASGTVIVADFDSTYGNRLVIAHNDSVTTLYGHNDELLVEVGQKVITGSRIALSGSTGKSTAPHLHYELRINDKPIDPLGSLYDEKE